MSATTQPCSMTSEVRSDIPPFISTSPVGFHIKDFDAFLDSGLAASISEDAEKLTWADSENLKSLINIQLPVSHPWKSNPKNKFYRQVDVIQYNQSRDYDRICPACRRWYRIGEVGFKEYTSFQDFINRPRAMVPEVPVVVAAFQQKRGICTSICYTVRSSLWDGFFQDGQDHLTPELVEEINGKPFGGLSARKPLPEENAQGIQVVYFKN